MTSGQEHSSSDASAPPGAASERLTAENVPRFFNWGAFLTPVVWCLGMREWLWAIPAATGALGLIVKDLVEWGSPTSADSIALGLIAALLFTVCPLWVSVYAGLCFLAGALDGGHDRPEFAVVMIRYLVYWLVPLGLSLYLGFAGNRLAARGRRFEDDRAFKRVQGGWAAWGIRAYPISIGLVFLAGTIYGLITLLVPGTP